MQKTFKKLLLVALVFAMVIVSFAACGATTPAPAASDAPAVAASDAPAADKPAADNSAAAAGTTPKGIVGSPDESYYMCVFVSGVEYWFPVYAGFKECGKQLGVQTYYEGTTEYEAQAQVEVFDNILAKNPTGIYLSPINADPFVEPINRAMEQGVMVATFASDSPDSNRPIYITSDNVHEGTFAARHMAEDMGGKGKVMTLTNPGQTNHDIRTDTFVKVIQAEYPDIEVVAQEVSKQDPDKAYSAVMTVAQKYPDLGGVFMPEANSGMGAARAAVELNNGLRVLCCDVNATILDMIKSGQIWGAIDPNQGCQGYMGMLSLFLACHPEYTSFMSPDEDQGKSAIQIPFLDNSLNIVTADTADYYYVDKYAQKLGYASVEDMLSPYIPEA
jgi:ribose transport system substrate-binding protein